MADFPPRTGNGTDDLINPSSRRFSIGEYPVKTYRALSGAVIKRSFGNRAFNYRLELEFQNVSETVVAVIYDHYHGQGGSARGFAIPPALLSGYEGSKVLDATFGRGPIMDRMRVPAQVQWFYEGAPQVDSTTLALSTISFVLIGELAY